MDDQLSNKIAQIKTIENGKGIQYILDRAYQILGNPLLAHDMDYKLIMHNRGAINDDPIWNEIISNGTVNTTRLKFYKDETFFDMVTYAEKITFLPSDRLKYDRIFGKLFVKGHIQVGCVVIHACDKPFEHGDMELFEMICELLNQELGKNEYYQTYGQAHMETLIAKLIENDFDNKAHYTAHIQSIYIGLKDHVRVAAVDISGVDPTLTRLACFRDLLKQTQPSFKYAVYAKHIVMLMGLDSESIDIKRDLRELYRIFEEDMICVGISSCVENSFDLSKYYKEAVDALEHGLKAGDSQRVFLYDGAG